MIRTPLSALGPGERTLDRDTSHYLCRVLRLGEGDAFVAFDPVSKDEADATITAPSPTAAVVTIGALRAPRVVAAAPLALVYALAKGDKVDAVVRDATELGATRVLIARTERAVAKVDGDRESTKLDRWKRIAEQAARQCGRSDPPAIEGVFAWPEALAAVDATSARFCLDPHVDDALGPALLAGIAVGTGLGFAIGPEGGLSPSELDRATALGFRRVALGRFVLRTETVAAAVLGAVRVLS